LKSKFVFGGSNFLSNKMWSAKTWRIGCLVSSVNAVFEVRSSSYDAQNRRTFMWPGTLRHFLQRWQSDRLLGTRLILLATGSEDFRRPSRTDMLGLRNFITLVGNGNLSHFSHIRVIKGGCPVECPSKRLRAKKRVEAN
jgi:hypothetical protein